MNDLNEHVFHIPQLSEVGVGGIFAGCLFSVAVVSIVAFPLIALALAFAVRIFCYVGGVC